MNGTEKQVKWAEDIRREAVEWARANIEELKRVGLLDEHAQALQERFSALVEAKQDAKWWIDRRKLQMGAPAEYQEDFSEELKKIVPALRLAINAKYGIQWEIRGLRNARA